MTDRIFLCHASEDKNKVIKIYDQLKALGLNPWLDKKDLLPGQQWDKEIRKALNSARFVLIFFSENSVSKRGYVQRELKLSLDTLEEIPEDDIFVIPVRFDDCQIPSRFSHLHYADLHEPEGFEQVVRALEAQGVKVQRNASVKKPNPVIKAPPPKPKKPEPYNGLFALDNFVEILPGSFRMGSDEDKSEQPIHTVHISKRFYLGKTPVTQKQWQAVMGENPSNFKGESRPVDSVSWKAAQRFINRLNKKYGKNCFRLPSEAEWEYAARGGKESEDYVYCGSDDPDNVAWHSENAGRETHPVGQKKGNEFGLYDMSGNVWEWCQDDWHDNYRGAPNDGSAWGDGTGSCRVLRGGSWGSSAQYCRSANRLSDTPVSSDYYRGIRIVSVP